MKWFGKTTLVLLALAIAAAVLYSRLGNDDERLAVEETRRVLRDAGFKIDLSEFNFFTSPELQQREAALANAGSVHLPNRQAEARLRSLRQQLLPALRQPVGTDAAILIWKQPTLPPDVDAQSVLQAEGRSDDWDWQVMRTLFHADRESLDAACLASLSGPIRFNLDASQGSRVLLPHLSAMKDLAQTLGCRAVLELHDGDREAAWTNALAVTRLVAGWQPEPIEVSVLVRIACASAAFDTIWQVLPAGGWGEERLSALQREWEEVDFFSLLPETAAYSRASAVAVCQQERQQPPLSFSLMFKSQLPPRGSSLALKEVLRAPFQAWAALLDDRRQRHYRLHGSYEDENQLLLHYRDREMELRRAIEARTWSEMRRFPGVTNLVSFQSRHRSRTQTLFNLRQISLSMLMYRSPGQVQSLPGRAAYAEAQRRLLVTAIALARYLDRRGSYPNLLAELVPEFLEHSPVDFMDGRPLRYRRTGDGHYVLYSVGFDGVDHGGRWPPAPRRRALVKPLAADGAAQEADLIWPRPASTLEAQAPTE